MPKYHKYTPEMPHSLLCISEILIYKKMKAPCSAENFHYTDKPLRLVDRHPIFSFYLALAIAGVVLGRHR